MTNIARIIKKKRSLIMPEKFSQRDEEPYILKVFEDMDNGRFLDIGAHDGETFSNTRALALKGWGGVLVEPSLSVLPALRERYGGNDKYRILECGIGLKRGSFSLFDSRGDLVSSFDEEHKKLWEKKGGTVFDEIQRPVMSVKDLFETVGYEFDFISLDAEAWSLDILEVLPFSDLRRVRMICVEFDLNPQRVLDAVEKHGYRQIHQTAENILVVK